MYSGKQHLKESESLPDLANMLVQSRRIFLGIMVSYEKQTTEVLGQSIRHGVGWDGKWKINFTNYR